MHGAAPCPIPVKQAHDRVARAGARRVLRVDRGRRNARRLGTWLRKPGTVGKPYPEDQIIVGDEDARPLPAGEIGMVWVKSHPGEEFEYFHDPEKTDRNQRGAWYTLGDVGYLDEDGYLFLSGRSAELIISGGVNIYPAEIDAVLLEHPAVRDAATIGVPERRVGRGGARGGRARPGRVGVTRARRPSCSPHCRARLARFKCPRSVEFVDELPRQDNGKVYRRVLRDRYTASR